MHLRSKTVQQLLSVILSVVMVLSMLPMEVLAQETPPVTTPMDLTAITEDTSGDGWSWTQSTKTLTLTGLTLTVSDDSTHALILPDGATIDLADGTTSTLTGGSRSTVYSSGEVKLRGSGSLTVYGRGWRSATLDMFIPGTLTVEYDDPDGGAVLKTDEGTEGAAICANVTLDNGILRATGPDFASADDGSSVGLRGRLTTHGSSVEAQLTARTGYASYGLYFDKQGSGRGDTWTMGLGKVTAAAGHALSRYSYGLYARGEVCYRFVHSRGQRLHDKLAKSGRRKELTVLDLLLSLRILMIVGKVRAFQAMQSTVSGIGIIDILAGDSRLFGQILIHQIEDLVVQLLSGFLGDRFVKVLILHSFTCSFFFSGERLLCGVLSEPRPSLLLQREKGTC